MKKHFFKIIAVLALISILLTGCGTSNPKKPETGTGVATLTAVGDIYFPQEMLAAARQADGTYDFSALLGDTYPLLTLSDLTFGNFEGNFAEEPYGAESGSYPDSLAQALADAGFDLIQTSNSYSIHNGLSGLERTKTVLRQNGITPMGTYVNEDERQAEQVLIREVNGVRIAFVAMTKGMGGLSLPENAATCVDLLYTDYTTNYDSVNTENITALMEEARSYDPDIIVAALHWGSENIREISSSQEKITNLLIENGVDVILGTHSHLVGQVEKRQVDLEGRKKEVIIAYGLGDYCAVADSSCAVSLALQLEFTRDHEAGTTAITDVSYVPLCTVDNGKEAAQRFTVLNAANALELYERNYYRRISDEVYEALTKQIDRLDGYINPVTEEQEPTTAE